MSKVEEYAEKLKKFEEKAEEEARLFDINEFLKDAETVLEKNVKGVGIVRYKRLSFIESMDLMQKYGNDKERFALALVATMLSKADPSVTIEKFGKLPTNIVVKIMNALAEEIRMDFLSIEKPSESGSSVT